MNRCCLPHVSSFFIVNYVIPFSSHFCFNVGIAGWAKESIFECCPGSLYDIVVAQGVDPLPYLGLALC